MARTRSRGVRTTRPVAWYTEGEFERISTVSGESGLIELVGNDQLDLITNATIVRLRGRLLVSMKKATSEGGTADTIAFGLAIGVVDANLIGLGDLLTATIADSSFMWMKWGILQSHHNRYPVYNSGASAVQFYSTQQDTIWNREYHEIDVKAMRRAGKDKKLVLAYTWRTEAGSPPSDGFQVRGLIRALIKE